MKTICYNFASRSRINSFFGVLDNIRKLSATKDYFVLVKLDTDDLKMNRLSTKTMLNGYPELIIRWGTSKSKIDAINRGIHDLPDYDIMVNISDDQKFIVEGYDDIIRKNFTDGVHFLHFQDSFAKDRVCTMNITTREYYEKRGFIYHPDYYSLWCDEEETIVAKMLGVYKLCEEEIFHHYHPTTSDKRLRIPKDPLYIRNDTYRKDERVFKERQNRCFDIETFTASGSKDGNNITQNT